MDRNLALRIAFAAAAIPLALGVIWYGSWLLVALVALVAVLGTRELYGLFRRTGGIALEATGLPAAAVLPPLVYASVALDDPVVSIAWPYLAALWLMLVLIAALAARKPTQRP